MATFPFLNRLTEFRSIQARRVTIYLGPGVFRDLAAILGTKPYPVYTESFEGSDTLSNFRMNF